MTNNHESNPDAGIHDPDLDAVHASFTGSDSELIRRAAELSGESPSDFVASVVIMQARAVLGARQVIHLTPEGTQQIRAKLEAPARPIPELQALAARHRELYGN